MSTTGQAVIVGDDPFGLNVTKVATFKSSTFPYQGRYPCGSLFYKGTWWYGTYYLDNPNATVGGNYVGPSPQPNCGNWCIQGPVVDFRHSTDKGETWHEDRVNVSRVPLPTPAPLTPQHVCACGATPTGLGCSSRETPGR